MLLRIDPSSPVSLADQIAAGARRAIADGKVRANEHLPPARELASGLGVNLHTVLRAYAILRDEGLIDLRRGRGAVVSPGARPGHAELATKINDVVRDARRLGLSSQEVAGLLRKAFSR
jgi:GntR family transcriptional regulator